MHNDPRGRERLRGTRFRTPARSGWPTTDRLKEMLPVGGRNGIPMVAVAAAAGIVATTVRGIEPVLSSHAVQPLHSRPTQALSCPLPRTPFWLGAVAKFPAWLKACA